MKPQTALGSQPVPAPASPKIVEAESLCARINDIHRLIARRAFELFESRGREAGHELGDWLRAESELLHPVPVEITESDGHLSVRAEVPGFSPTDIEVGVEPRRLIISGRTNRAAERKQGEIAYTTRLPDESFRALDLPAAVDPGQLRATLKDGILELTLPVVATRRPAAQA